MNTKKHTPKVAIIVPVYDVADYIESCLSSILSQTYQDFELILVNDCSPDKRDREICLKFEEKDARVTFLELVQNSGSGGARNAGIKVTQAEYILFVDSDDEIEEDMVEKLFHLAQKYKTDLTVCEYFDLDKERSMDNNYTYSSQKKSSLEYLLPFSKGKARVSYAPWGKLWRRSLFIDNDIFFPIGIRHQDMATIPRLLHFVEKLFYTDVQLYRYRTREGSAVNSLPKFKEYFIIFDLLLTFIKDANIYNEYRARFYNEFIYQQTLYIIKRLKKYEHDNTLYRLKLRELFSCFVKHKILFSFLNALSLKHALKLLYFSAGVESNHIKSWNSLWVLPLGGIHLILRSLKVYKVLN